MKTTRTLFTMVSIIFTAFFIVSSCKGPQGDPGPVGPQGGAGPQGAQGPMGNANVVYSDWKIMNWTQVLGSGSGNNSTYGLSNPTTTTNPLFTKEAINSAAIFNYIKYHTYEETGPGTQKYRLVERISSQPSVLHYFKVPGRTDTGILDYGFSYVYSGDIGENYFSPYMSVNTFTLGYQIPELKNLSANAVRALVSTMPQFRHVIVYGNVKGRQAIDFNDYAAVKKAFNLPD